MPIALNKKIILSSSAVILTSLFAISTSSVSAQENTESEALTVETVEVASGNASTLNEIETVSTEGEVAAEEETVGTTEAEAEEAVEESDDAVESVETTEETPAVEEVAEEDLSPEEVKETVAQKEVDKEKAKTDLEVAIETGEKTAGELAGKAAPTTEKTEKEQPKREIDYARLNDFMKKNRKQFNQIVDIANKVAKLSPDEVTDYETIISLGEVVLDEAIDPEVLLDLAAFVSEFGNPIQVSAEEIDGSGNSRLEEGYEIPGHKPGLADWKLGEGNEDFIIDEILKKGIGTTDAILSVIENRLNGRVSPQQIGAIIDQFAPTGSLFSDIGGLIERIAYLRAEAVRQDVLKGTEIVGAIAELIPSEVTFNGTPVNYVINKLGAMAGDIGKSVADGMVSWLNPGSFYNVKTWRLRAQLFAEAAKTIHTATTEWRRKPQVVHSKAGLEITHALMAVVDPFSDVTRLQTRLSELLAVVKFGNGYRDITPLDVATTYVKEELDRAIWAVRLKRDEYILTKVPFKVYHELNRAITKAVGVQLNPETLVFEIDGAVKALNAAYQKAEEFLNNIPREEQIAPNALKRELNDLIWKTRLERDKSVLGKVSSDVYFDLNKVLTKAVSLHAGIKSKTVEVEAVMNELKTTLADAKEKAATFQAEKASKAIKNELSDLIWNVRKQRDSILLGKIPAEAYHNLNKVITAAVGVQLMVNATNEQVSQAMENLKAALTQAKTFA